VVHDGHGAVGAALDSGAGRQQQAEQ